VLVNEQKTPLFSADERVAMIAEVFRDLPGVEVDTFDGLLVDYARGAAPRSCAACARCPTSNTSSRWR
jgi:pantetheine-phosphate adenylyltransferase